MKHLTLKKAAIVLLAIGLLTLLVGFAEYAGISLPRQDVEFAPKELVAKFTAADEALSARAYAICRAGWLLVGVGGIMLLINFGLRRGNKKE